MLYSVLPIVVANQTPGNRKIIDCISILLKFIFDTRKHTIPSYAVLNINYVSFLRKENIFTFALLFHLPVPI